MRRLLCALVALALLLAPALSQSIVASAASRRVQSRVEQVLERGSRYLTPESLLLPAKSKLLSAAAAFSDGPSPTAADSKFGVAAAPAAANTNTAAATIAAEVQQVTPEGDVSVAAKELHIKWAVKQTGTMTVESDDDDAESYLHSQDEAADLLRRTGRLVQQPSAGHTEVEYVEVIPGLHEPGQVHEEREMHVHQTHEPEQHRHQEEKQQQHRRPDHHAGPSDISKEPKAEEADLIQRLTQVDWQAVFEVAQREAETEEQAAEAKRQAEAEARKAELKKRIAAAEAERRQADAERQKTEAERQRLIEERHQTDVERKETQAVRERLEEQRQKADNELQQAEAVERRAAKEAEAVKERVAEDRQKAAADREQAEAVKRRAAKEAEAAKERIVEDRHKAAEERQKAEAVRHSAEAERRKQQQAAAAAEEAKKKAAPSDAQHHYEEHKRPRKQLKDDYKDDEKHYERESEYESDSYEDVHRTKVLIQEKGRSPLRYFPGGGIYSFTSELTCISDNEYYEKLAFRSFPMITPRMTKITVGLCEWTVAEVSPTQVNKNVFLLGNAWATCTFLPIAEKECAKPIVGGLTMTIQALQYQFAQPTGIREPDADDYEGEDAADSKTKKSSSAAKVGIASATVAKQVSKPSASAMAKGSNVTAATAATTAATAPAKRGKGRGKYLMDVELQNVFLGLITGAFGPKKAHKYKQGAVQFAFGPPADTEGKSYAIETRLPTVAMGGPSVEELQEGMIQLVPGTYQFVFDQE